MESYPWGKGVGWKRERQTDREETKRKKRKEEAGTRCRRRRRFEEKR